MGISLGKYRAVMYPMYRATSSPHPYRPHCRLHIHILHYPQPNPHPNPNPIPNLKSNPKSYPNLKLFNE